MRIFFPRLRMIEVAMKTTNQIQRLLPVSTCLLFAITAMSCQTNIKPTAVAVQQPVTRKNWVKISSQPPTYYPTGVAADSPTDHWTGEWVYTDDAKGSRYFIPHHGLGKIPRQTLVHEALSARSERRLAQIANEDREIRDRNVRNTMVYGPPLIAANVMCLALTMGQQGVMIDDFARWQKEWHTSKQPEDQ
jgi:hypothetical protein